jgi:hypothetical protein
VSVWKEVGLEFNGCHCLLSEVKPSRELVSTQSYKELLAKVD